MTGRERCYYTDMVEWYQAVFKIFQYLPYYLRKNYPGLIFMLKPKHLGVLPKSQGLLEDLSNQNLENVCKCGTSTTSLK